ncbi:MAG: hypothetical protein ACK5NB_09100 [Flavobacteriaceae bacterium]
MLKNGNIKTVFVAILLFLTTIGTVRAQQLWAEVQLNKSSVFVGEPVEVSITVYTETWFTRGLDLGNINVQGAFTTYFRPVSTSVVRNGKNFSGVKLIYNVFPYSENDIVFPSLKIEVETPPVGGYKGAKRTVNSSERKIKVKPVPPDFDKTGWLVASNLTVEEHWSGNKTQVKVGDVLSRTITRRASGTVAELIPPSVWDNIALVSSYPGKGSVENFRSKTAISAQRSESIQYLFEKEGTVIIPERVYTWYNPHQKKLYKRTLDALEIKVLPNPDLGMLATVRDSLQLQQADVKAASGEKKPRTILGLSVRDFVLAVLVLVTLLVLLIKILKKMWQNAKEKRLAYENSETYFFSQLKKAIRKGNTKQTTNALYRWIDALDLDRPTVGALLKRSGLDKNTSTEIHFEENKPPNIKQVSLIRKQYLEHIKRATSAQANKSWITP